MDLYFVELRTWMELYEDFDGSEASLHNVSAA